MADRHTQFAQAAGVVDPSRGGPVAVTVPNSFTLRKHFADMRVAMAIDAHSRSTAGHDWFENRAGGMENFNKLQEHVLNPNFQGDAQFPKADVDRLRATMSASNYNAAEVERQVRGIVIHASTPTGTAIPENDRQRLDAIVKGIQEQPVPQTEAPTRRAAPLPPTR